MRIVRHSRPHFFKFATTEAALKIIEGRSLKWSSATAFNDPFDHQAGFSLDLEESHFAKLLTDSMLRVIFSDAPVSVGASARFTQMLLVLRQMRDRLPQDQIGKELYGASLEVAKNLRDGINELRIQPVDATH